MSMPNNALSQITLQYKWKGRYVDDPTSLHAYQEAGIGIADPSMGMQYQLWSFIAIDKDIHAVDALNNSTLLYTAATSIEELGGCFDQNMHPFIVFKAEGQWHYRWYNSITSSNILTDLPNGVTSCQCTLDDNRAVSTSTSDILLFYTLNNNLYMRRQRDRYQTEYMLRTGINATLIKVAMNGLNRLQFKLQVVR